MKEKSVTEHPVRLVIITVFQTVLTNFTEVADTCTKCDEVPIALSLGGQLWCHCTLKSADRELRALREKVNASFNHLTEIEAELVAERETSDRLQRVPPRRTEESQLGQHTRRRLARGREC